MRTDTNGQRILLSVTRPLALSDKVTMPLILICTSSSFFMIIHLASMFKMSTPLANYSASAGRSQAFITITVTSIDAINCDFNGLIKTNLR